MKKTDFAKIFAVLVVPGAIPVLIAYSIFRLINKKKT
jgi:hypothetical protein